MTINVFISYSHKDKEFFDRLRTHLASLERDESIKVWCDKEILGGDSISAEISKAIDSSGILLCLMSADYLNSDACMDELDKAQENIRAIPIILKPCHWQIEKLKDTLALPMDGKPVETWHNREEAFTNVVKEIARVVKKLEESRVRKISHKIQQAYTFGDEEKLEEFAKDLNIPKKILSFFYENSGKEKKSIDEWGKDLADFIAEHKASKVKAKEFGGSGDIQKAINDGEFTKADKLIEEKLTNLSNTNNVAKNKFVNQVIEKANWLEMAAKIKSLKLDHENVVKYLEQAFSTLENDLPNSSKTKQIKEKIIEHAEFSGRIYYVCGMDGKGKNCFMKALDCARRYLHDDSLRIAELYGDLSISYIKEENYDEAENYARNSVAITKKILGENDKKFADALNFLAVALAHQGKHEEAKVALEKAAKIIKNCSPIDYWLLVKCLNDLAELHIKLACYPEAEKILNEAISITEEFIGKDSITMSTCLSSLAIIYYEKGLYNKSQEILEPALQIARKTAGRKSIMVDQIQNQLYLIKQAQKQES